MSEGGLVRGQDVSTTHEEPTRLRVGGLCGYGDGLVVLSALEELTCLCVTHVCFNIINLTANGV